jgi:hypothetical protein
VLRTRPIQIAGAVVAAVAAVALTGCGWLGANDKSSIKPNGFVLFGHAAVILRAHDHRAAGTACTSPVTTVTPGTSVRVLDPGGKVLGTTFLGEGVIGRDATTATCNFPFALQAIPGGVETYAVQIGNRSPQQFAATTLRQNNAAVITIAQ